jgi:hypothetical protein
MPNVKPSHMTVNNLENGHKSQSRDINKEYTTVIKRNIKTRKLDLSEQFMQLLNE